MDLADKIRIKYAPDTFLVIKNPEDQFIDLYLVYNPNGSGPGVRALVIDPKNTPIIMDKFLEKLN